MKKHHVGIGMVVLAVLAAVFLYSRLGSTGFVWAEFVKVLAGVRADWMAAAIPLILLAYVVRAWRWKVMIRPLAPSATLWQMTVATFIGFTAVVLFGRAGEPVRPYLIARKQGIPFSSQVAAWLVERMLDLLMVLVLFGASLTQLRDEGWAPDSKMHLALRAGGWAAGLAGGGCLLALVALRRYRGRIRSRLEEALTFLPEKPLERVRAFIHAFDEGMQSTRDPLLVWYLVGLTMLEWALVGGSFLSVLQAFPAVAHLSVSEALTTMGFVTFAGVIQVPGVGGGMQIATVLVLTELYGISVEAASGVALVIWATSFLISLPIGFAMAFHEGIRWRTMKQMSQEHSLDLQ